MKRIAILLAMLSFPAQAAQHDKVSDAIVEAFASAHFCDRPRPRAEKGDIVVWWERDPAGHCTIQRAAAQ